MLRWLALVLAGLLAISCGKGRKASPPPEPNAEVTVPAALLDAGFFLQTSSDSDDRVAKVFPKGPATEDARAKIGTAPAPPNDAAPEPASEIVLELTPTKPIELATIFAALGEANEHALAVRGRLANGAWEYVRYDPATGPYARVAVVVSITDIDTPTPATELDHEIAWARAFLGKLEKREPTQSMTTAAAIAKATAAFKLRANLPDDAVEIAVIIAAPTGKRFPGRLVWDVVYSAGFRWGDGDYFHWVPSPSTDISQGIGIATDAEPGYFLPESLAQPAGGDVPNLVMSFSLARVTQPDAMLDVMQRAASYMAQRLGGSLLDTAGAPYDLEKQRAQVKRIVEAMTAAGIAPGSPLALQIF